MTSADGPASAGGAPTGAAVVDRSSGRWSAALGVVWLVAAVTLAAVSWSVLLAGHPAQLVALGVVALVGLLLIGRSLLRRRRRRRRVRAARRSAWRVVARILAVVATAAVIGAFVYLKPFGASPDAVAAMRGEAGVLVVDTATTITLTPAGAAPRTGLIFQPGARVDPRAYVPILAQVSRAGVLVVIIKQPFDIGFTAVEAPSAVIDGHPEVASWAVGGHSLGGVAASSYAGSSPRPVRGLVLWASYPLDALAGRSLKVASISGTDDGLATPADIEASRPNLPAATVFTAVPGGVHAFFGDYGDQPGDGRPATTRADAQRQIAAATVALLRTL